MNTVGNMINRENIYQCSQSQYLCSSSTQWLKQYRVVSLLCKELFWKEWDVMLKCYSYTRIKLNNQIRSIKEFYEKWNPHCMQRKTSYSFSIR